MPPPPPHLLVIHLAFAHFPCLGNREFDAKSLPGGREFESEVKSFKYLFIPLPDAWG